ncbi:Uncharacterised protein [Mycobacteroides abscessus subsp. abscessus]|nr:Uncharacterised protein [Mycobacteroides abscessus subsp. abscessus]
MPRVTIPMLNLPQFTAASATSKARLPVCSTSCARTG